MIKPDEEFVDNDSIEEEGEPVCRRGSGQTSSSFEANDEFEIPPSENLLSVSGWRNILDSLESPRLLPGNRVLVKDSLLRLGSPRSELADQKSENLDAVERTVQPSGLQVSLLRISL